MNTSYLTAEQIQRLAALSLDCLVGIQFDTDDSDNTGVTGCYVDIDTGNLVFFGINADGTLTHKDS